MGQELPACRFRARGTRCGKQNDAPDDGRVASVLHLEHG